MAKHLLCRLRLPKWDDRENPETNAGYQVCLRCNAHRDRGMPHPVQAQLELRARVSANRGAETGSDAERRQHNVNVIRPAVLRDSRVRLRTVSAGA
jgi:hypothetical protein